MKALLIGLVLTACARSAPTPVAPVAAPKAAPAPQPEKRGRIVVSDSRVDVLDPITFVGATAALAPTSTQILDSIASTLEGNPTILLVQIRSHVDSSEVSDPRARAELSVKRAEVVVAQLVARGIAATRLEPYGASDSEPISTTNRALNTRIEILMVDRSRGD